MKAPKKTTELFNASVDYGYSPVQWLAVRNALKAIRIDLAVIVSFVEPWGDHEATSRSLADVLQDLAGYFGARARLGRNPLTPKRQVKTAKKTLAALKAALAIIDEAYFCDERDTLEQRRARFSSVDAVRSGLTELIPQQEQWKACCDKLAITDDGRRRNAVAAHTEYWLALIQLWRSMPTVRRQQKHLCEFLLICSKPLFPAATTETTVTGFIERYFPQSNR